MDYNRTKISPHSQPFFAEADIESDIDNDYEESQSLISSRKRYSNEHGSTSSSAVTEYYSDLSTKVLEANSEMILNESGLPDSQPLFTEAKIDTASDIGHDKSKTRKIDTMPITEEFLPSISVSSMNQRNSKVSSSAITINYSDSNIKVLEANSKKFTNEQEAKRDSVSDSYSKNEDNVTHVTCINCIFDKELDKRNYYFGNLLIGELQFLQPCMRSEAYVTIFRYIDSLKQKHCDRQNN